MKLENIRALGFDWPGSDSMDQYAVESGGDVDLDATVEALRRGLSVYQRQLDEMREYQRTWNAGVDADAQAGAVNKAAEMRRAIELVEAIRKKVGQA